MMRLTPERLEALRIALSQAPETASLEYTSKDQAMQQLRARLGERARILEGLHTNPLPASFTITIRDEFRRPELLRERVERYKQLPEIEDIDYGERWLERFHTLVWTLEIGVIGIGGIMGVAVMFIIATTVRLALYTRAEEIEIMQLVGATLWFIKVPFFLEGILQGMLGASLAVGLCYGLFAVLMTWVRPMGELFLRLLPVPVPTTVGHRQHAAGRGSCWEGWGVCSPSDARLHPHEHGRRPDLAMAHNRSGARPGVGIRPVARRRAVRHDADLVPAVDAAKCGSAGRRSINV